MSAEQELPLKLQKGDHIVLMGNTLADRMQHDGWLETLLQTRFPRHELVVRDLGYSGDELTLRLRSDGFGSPDQWLKFNKTDIVFAFFGYNESYGGAGGLDRFKKDLDSFIKHTLSQNYNGKNPPRLVLFSPIAFENLRNRNLPDGSEHNKRLALYTAVLAAIRPRGLRVVEEPVERAVCVGVAGAEVVGSVEHQSQTACVQRAAQRSGMPPRGNSPGGR